MPAEITSLRQKLGLTRNDFASLFHWSLTKLAIYEAGALLSEEDNGLLKVLAALTDRWIVPFFGLRVKMNMIWFLLINLRLSQKIVYLFFKPCWIVFVDSIWYYKHMKKRVPDGTPMLSIVSWILGNRLTYLVSLFWFHGRLWLTKVCHSTNR